MIRFTPKNKVRFGLISVLLLAPLAIYAFRDKPSVRWGMHRSLDYFYSNADVFSETHAVNFGPNPESAESFLPGGNPQLKVTQIQNLPLNTKMGEEFGHEWLGHQRVKILQKILPFNVDSTSSVFELSQQVRSLSHHSGTPLPDVGTDPIQYLNFAIDHRGMTCRYFSVIYGASARLAGYTTRLIALSKSGTNRDHAVSEVYVPEFSKWILIDSDFNVAYRRRGVWLNANELSHAWCSVREFVKIANAKQLAQKEIQEEVRRKTGIEVVELGTAAAQLRQSNMYAASSTGINLEFFEYVFYSVRNDYLSASYPAGHPVRSREYVLQCGGQKTTPQIAPEAYPIQNIDEFYWPVGRSRIEIAHWAIDDSPSVTLRLSTWTPNFVFWEMNRDAGEWKRIDSIKVNRSLCVGTNTFGVRSVNQAGLRGEVARIKIQSRNKMAQETPATKVQND